MLPSIHSHSKTKTVTLVSLFLFVFSICSWTLAANIVESQAISPNVGPDPVPPVTSGENDSDQTPPLNLPSSPPTKGQVPEPADEKILQPLFLTEPYSMQVLGGNSSEEKRIALTFDDGPVAGWTEKYLAVLDEKEVPAAFFVIGRLAEKHGDLIRQIVAAGYDIGTHSQTHRRLTDLGESSIKQELVDSSTAIYRNTKQSVIYFRPPYGAYNSLVKTVAHGLGQTVVAWNVDPRDWDTADSKQIVAEVLRQVRPGSIILLHEGKPQTLQALPIIIDRLQQEGYEFTTVSDLFGFEPSKQTAPVMTDTHVSTTKNTTDTTTIIGD
jgi:peptidoglycan/xylan/chitin deacetylase (PgdA/CDA1 family)